MKHFLHLLKHDFRLLHRNNIILVSIIVTVLYILTFHGLNQLIDTEKLLVLVIFNDPALLGFLFIGVMMLFEKNENTIYALAVSPIKIDYYLLARSISLSLIALVCCLAMAISAKGLQFNIFHFIMATLLSSMIFSFIGFIAVAGETSFNSYLLKAIGILLFLSLPFFGYFNAVNHNFFVLFPTQSLIELYDISFSEHTIISEQILAYAFAFFWMIISYYFAKKAIIENFSAE